MPRRPSEDTPPEYLRQGEPVLCRCWRWRHNLMGDHRDWRAEYERARLAGIIPDEVWADAMLLEQAGAA